MEKRAENSALRGGGSDQNGSIFSTHFKTQYKNIHKNLSALGVALCGRCRVRDTNLVLFSNY